MSWDEHWMFVQAVYYQLMQLKSSATIYIQLWHRSKVLLAAILVGLLTANVCEDLLPVCHELLAC